MGRRFEIKGEVNGVRVIDDYGHHPTEILATLAAARTCCTGRVHVLFQPHRYTRTMHLMDEFAKAFHEADRVVPLDIYAASETPHRRCERRTPWPAGMRESVIAMFFYAGSNENRSQRKPRA